MQFRYRSKSERATMKLGYRLAEVVPAETVIALVGDLGVGKTHFVQGFAEGLGITDPVQSPTFTLVAEYRDPSARLPLFHMDAYRLETAGQFIDSGLDEYFEEAGVTLIEWADLVKEALPASSLVIRIQRVNQAEIDIEELEHEGQIVIAEDDGLRILDFSLEDSSPLASILEAFVDDIRSAAIDDLEEEIVE